MSLRVKTAAGLRASPRPASHSGGGGHGSIRAEQKVNQPGSTKTPGAEKMSRRW